MFSRPRLRRRGPRKGICDVVSPPLLRVHPESSGITEQMNERGDGFAAVRPSYRERRLSTLSHKSKKLRHSVADEALKPMRPNKVVIQELKAKLQARIKKVFPTRPHRATKPGGLAQPKRGLRSGLRLDSLNHRLQLSGLPCLPQLESKHAGTFPCPEQPGERGGVGTGTKPWRGKPAVILLNGAALSKTMEVAGSTTTSVVTSPNDTCHTLNGNSTKYSGNAFRFAFTQKHRLLYSCDKPPTKWVNRLQPLLSSNPNLNPNTATAAKQTSANSSVLARSISSFQLASNSKQERGEHLPHPRSILAVYTRNGPVKARWKPRFQTTCEY
jgi:hypothetical protein